MYLPQLSTATSSHLLWIHETGLCTEVSQCHQATLHVRAMGNQIQISRNEALLPPCLAPFKAFRWLILPIPVSWGQPLASRLKAIPTDQLCAHQPRDNWHRTRDGAHLLQHNGAIPRLSPPFHSLLSDSSPWNSTPHAGCLDVKNNTKILNSSMVKVLFKRCLVTAQT